MFGKSLVGLILVVYMALLAAGVALLSHYPWSLAPDTSQIQYPDPPDFRAYTNIQEKKIAFFDYLRPLVQSQNQALLSKRQKLLAIRAHWSNTTKLSERDRQRLKQTAAAFDLPLEAFTHDGQLQVRNLLDALLLRVNVLPEALVLAQAASESAWGTSRFARRANNYFGQWCFSQGCGLVPKHRPAGATHEVAKFNSVAESVQAYFHNINTFTAYEALRTERAKQPQNVTANQLLPTLVHYSERGEAYIQDLKNLIRQNQLDSKASQEATERLPQK